MDETSTLQTLKEAVDKLREQVAVLVEEASRRARGEAPRTGEALRQGYDEAAGVLRALAARRSVQAAALAAVVGLVVGLCLAQRR